MIKRFLIVFFFVIGPVFSILGYVLVSNEVEWFGVFELIGLFIITVIVSILYALARPEE